MLKRGFLVLMLATGLAACDDDTPTTPADPNLAVFTAQLSAQNEVGQGTPATSNTETTARGDVRIEFHLTRDGSNNITGSTVDFTVNMTGMPAGSTWTLAHIHEGVAGIAGGVRVNTGLNGVNDPSTAIPMVNGGITGKRFEGIVVSGTQTNAILNNPSGFYFNAHTLANPQGVMRGQLVPQ